MGRVFRHIDTCIAVWISDRSDRIRPFQKEIETSVIVVSPMVLLELHLLSERGRLHAPAMSIWADIQRSVAATLSTASFTDIALQAAGLSWTRGPFDRLITANALADGMPLITSDRHIRTHMAMHN